MAGVVAGARFRGRWRSTALVVVLVALTTGVVLAALAGARRTDAALPAFLRYHRTADAYAVFVPKALGGPASPDLAPEVARIRAIPGVREATRFTNAIVVADDPAAGGGKRRLLPQVSMEPGGLAMLGRPRIIAGRLPREDRADEIAVDEELARDARLHVGSRYHLRAYTVDQLGVAGDATAPPTGHAVTAHVTAIVRSPTDLRDLQAPSDTDSIYLTHRDLYLTAAFWAAAGGDLAGYNPVVGVVLDRSTTAAEFATRASRALGDPTAQVLSAAEFTGGEGTLQGVERAVSLQSRSLQFAALAAAVTGLFLVSQTLGRQLTAHAEEDAVLGALGATRLQRWQATTLQAAAVAITGAALGVLVAVALSPLVPLPHTTAARALLDAGVAVDTTVLLAGALVAAVAVTLAATLSARRAGSLADEPDRRGRPTFAARLAAAGAAAPAVVGVRFALEPGRGRTAVPVRSAMVISAVAVAGVVGATVFTHSLDGTRTEPARFGVTWDVSAGAMTSVEEAAAASSRLRRIDGVGAFSGVVTNDVQIAGTPVTTLFVRPDRGWVGPLITDGHAPNGAEIALGAETMRRLHLHIGDEVPVSVFDGPTARFRVSGRAVLNDSGIEGAITPGKGAAISWSAIPFLAPPGEEIEDPAPQSFLIRFTPGADAAGVTAAIERVFPGSTSPAIVPADLLNLVDVSALPLVLGAALALIGLGAVIHALLGCVTRRRRDIAVLKALGFAGREVRAAVGCQTVVFAAVALAVGVPLGVAAGRVTWSVTAHQLAIVDHPVVPVAALAAACGAFVVGLVVVTLVPARLAARVPATVILRDE